MGFAVSPRGLLEDSASMIPYYRAGVQLIRVVIMFQTFERACVVLTG